jgi:uncharacterized protein
MARIDAHTHVFAPWQVENRDALCTRDETFRELYADPKAALASDHELRIAMFECNLDRAVTAGFAFTHERDIAQQNEYLLHIAAEDTRFIPLATVNPGIVGWERSARRALQAGARGFGELRPGNQGWDPLGPAGHALCTLAKESGAVLLWHVSEPVGHRYPGKAGGISAAQLGQLAETFPGVRMIAAHLGGGLSFFLHMPEVRKSFADVYFDTAAATLLYDEQSVARVAALAGVGRVLFGSDFPLLSPRRQLQRMIALLPVDLAEGVCGGNATTLFSD